MKIIAFLSLVFLMACSSRIVLTEQQDWYGPAHMAIEDYTKYYYMLPSSLEDLRGFIEFRIRSCPDASTLYFGDAKVLLNTIAQKHTSLVSNNDSCVFVSRRGLREKAIVYSPDYQFRHIDYFQKHGTSVDFHIALFDDSGRRVNREEEETLFRRIQRINEGYRHYLAYRENKRPCWLLFEFKYASLCPIMGFPNTNCLIGRSRDNQTAMDIDTEINDICSQFFGEIEKVLTDYQTQHIEVNRIILSSALFF
ncbi:MAG: hypothetical protein K6D54_08425 [Bacteroidales bacterium]|nr:hypothetical protein [Bacteroidales bacterium]